MQSMWHNKYAMWQYIAACALDFASQHNALPASQWLQWNALIHVCYSSMRSWYDSFSNYLSVYLPERPVWKIFHHSHPSHSTSIGIHFPFYQPVLPVLVVLWLHIFPKPIKCPRLRYWYQEDLPFMLLHCHCCQPVQWLHQCFTTLHSFQWN